MDLGCGSGLLARELTKSQYKVLGIDLSEAMIRIARRRVPEAEFRIASLFKADIPPCNAVTSIGECLNYLFDSNNDSETLAQLFHRIYAALAPGGVFIFDIAEQGQVAEGTATRGFSEAEDWTVLVEKREERGVLTRRIISFRKAGKHYRRSDETHRQRLYNSKELACQLRQAGFRARTIRSYGDYNLPKAHAAFIARKPS